MYLGLAHAAYPHHIDADLVPSFHFDADMTFLNLMRMRIRILTLVKVMRISDHWYTDTERRHFEPPQLLNFHAHPNPDPAFHSDAEPDPASQNDAELYGSGSATLHSSLTRNM
jgi:hypothetical protein